MTALLIDEAQSLSDELLEEIRLLANTETTTEKLLTLVLAGQPELRDRLNETELRQLKQRVTLRSEIGPFSQQETAAYIAWRIRTAGGDASKLFTREAVMLIHERSGGIPRTISVICDNALLTGFGLGRQPVTHDMVREVAHDFDLGDARPREVSTVVGSEPHDSPVPSGEMAEQTSSHASSFASVELIRGTPGDVPAQEERPMFNASRTRPRFSFFGTR
jgi:hypothetical protein